MGWITLLICIIATLKMFQVSSGMGSFALIVSIVNLWSLGIMHNYADGDRIRSGYERFIVTLNLLTGLIGLILLIVGFSH
jgi:hypothetical protein